MTDRHACIHPAIVCAAPHTHFLTHAYTHARTYRHHAFVAPSASNLSTCMSNPIQPRCIACTTNPSPSVPTLSNSLSTVHHPQFLALQQSRAHSTLLILSLYYLLPTFNSVLSVCAHNSKHCRYYSLLSADTTSRYAATSRHAQIKHYSKAPTSTPLHRTAPSSSQNLISTRQPHLQRPSNHNPRS